VYALLSLIQAMSNMSTLGTNDLGKSFWELVYGSVNQVLADHRPAVLYDMQSISGHFAKNIYHFLKNIACCFLL